jgi:hypothetical protein
MTTAALSTDLRLECVSVVMPCSLLVLCCPCSGENRPGNL